MASELLSRRVYHLTDVPTSSHSDLLYKPTCFLIFMHATLRTVCGRNQVTTRVELRSAERKEMESQQEREELDARARQGETVVRGGTGGKSLEAQEHLAEGRSRGGQTRKEQLGKEGYQEMGQRGGETRKDQIGSEGYQEMGRKGGLSTIDKSGQEHAAEEGIDIDETKFRTRTTT